MPPARIHDRLRRVLALASTAIIGAIVLAMWVTESLDPRVRWLAVLVLVALVFLVQGSVLRRQVALLVEEPLAECVAATEAIAAGDNQRRVAPTETAEFQQLAASINRMTEQLLAANQQRMRVEKLATMGRLAAGISHEIGNPASAIANYAHVLRQRTAQVPGAAQPLDALEREITRIDRIMRGLLDYARPKRLTPRPIAVDGIIDDVVRLLSDQGVLRHVRIERELGAPDGTIYAERHDLEQVFVNLVLNAADAMDEAGTLAIRTVVRDVQAFRAAMDQRRSDPVPTQWAHRPSRRALAWLARPDAPSRFLQVVLADSGAGVPTEDEERIFEPFYSTKQPGKGTGLGLAIVASTIENLGGTIWVQRAREGGAAFVVLLPLYSSGLPAISADDRPAFAG
jgi:signal transduction histidine kinase